MQDAITKLARGRDCMVRVPGICCADPATVVLAHYRLIGLSGLGIKSPSVIGAWACHTCHTHIDTHHDAETKLMHAEGVFRTQAALLNEGKIVTWR